MADSNSFEKRFARIAGNPTLGVCAASQCGEEADAEIEQLKAEVERLLTLYEWNDASG